MTLITDVAVQLVQSDDGRKWTHVYVYCDDGEFGIGEATYSHKELVVAEMVRALKPHVIGQDPFDTERMYLDLYSHGRAGYRTGGVMFTSAISGIDQALWDLKGKLLGVPVCAMLGGPRSASVPVYSHVHGDSVEYRIEDALLRLSEGFSGVKSSVCEWLAPGSRVSRSQLRKIVAFFERYREALGEDVAIMEDMHGMYEVGAAMEVAKALEPFDLLFLEEPTYPDDPRSFARIRNSTTTTIAGSERITSKFRYDEFFRAGAVDVAQPDIVYIGGITEMKKVATVAELYQVTLAPHNTKGPVGIMAAAHVMASIPNGLTQEMISPTVSPWRDSVLETPVVVKDGALEVADRPGLGIVFDQDALAEHVIFSELKSSWRG